MRKEAPNAYKKIIALCVVLAALALPAMASASPVLTDTEPAGTVKTVAAGSHEWAINSGNVKFTTSIGTIECTNGRLTGTVLKNSGAEIEATISSVEINNGSATSPCTTTFLGNFTVTVKRLPWCLKAGFKLPVDTWELKGGDCGTSTGEIEFTLDTTLVGECTYKRAAITGTFTTSTTANESSILKTEKEGEFVKTAGGGGCPGSGQLDMTFDLWTETESGGVGPRIWIS